MILSKYTKLRQVNDHQGNVSLLFLLIGLPIAIYAVTLLQTDLKLIKQLPAYRHSHLNSRGQALLEFIIWSTFYISLILVLLNAFCLIHQGLSPSFSISNKLMR